MNETLHHIRLAAGLEIESGGHPRRTLTRDHASELASHLAADLARVLPAADQTLLVVGAGLFEPNELLRPGLPAWQGLEELSTNLLRQSGFRPQVIAFGSHGGQMPHAGLQPPDSAPLGQFLVLPLLLVCPDDVSQSIEAKLEDELFEKGSIDPPARALLHAQAGVDSVHGQLLTTNDLIALQHVQLDSVGLGAFWGVIEHLSLADQVAHDFELPGHLRAAWDPVERRVDIRFTSHDQAIHDGTDYPLWTRAFRTLTTLLDTHGVAWQPRGNGAVTFDPRQQMMIETAGTSDLADSLTMHRHPDLGLVAWTLVEDGRILHLYPLRHDLAGCLEQELTARRPGRTRRCDHIHIDPASKKLAPAVDS